jgi:hypothetical protein
MGALNIPPQDQNGQDALRDFYKVLIDTRNVEIHLFWQRSNYFLILNTGIAFGFFNLKEARYVWIMAIFGLLASILWFRVCLGGKYWQARWEQRLQDFEREHFPHLVFFLAPEGRVREDASRGLLFFELNPIKRFVYKQASRSKPSVSFSMILLALLFVFGWMALIGILLVYGNPMTPKTTVEGFTYW